MSERLERREQLAELDRRTWHLWALSLAITLALALAITAFFYPAIKWHVNSMETRFGILPQLVFGLLTLVFLGALHIVLKQRELNEMRNLIIAAYSEVGMFGEHPRDPLTGALDRRALPDILKRESTRAGRYQGTLCLALFDIRGFRKINENEGHMAGDLILKDLGKTLQVTTRQTDSVLRYGADEFLCFLAGTDRAGGEGFARRLSRACEKSSRLSALTLDFGFAVHQMGVDLEVVLADVERDLEAKRNATAGAPLPQPPSSQS